MQRSRTWRNRIAFLFEAKGFRHRLTSIGHLLSGNFLNAAIMLVSVAVAARSLGPEAYGIMVLVLTFGRTVERLLRFESWQPIIKFAAAEEENDDRGKLSQLYLYGLILDCGAVVLAAVVTLFIAWAFGSLVGMSPLHLELVAIYCVALLFNINGMPTAALRFAGRFRTLAYSQLASNVLRIGLAFVCAWLDLGLVGFIAAWTIAQIAGSLIFIFLGFRAIASMSIPNPLRAPIRGMRARFPGFLSFAWSTNISTTLRTMTHEADALLVGALAGPAAAGVYHIAKRMAKVAQQAGAQVQAVLYPDMARLWAKGEVRAFRSIILQVQLALASVGGVALIAGFLLGDWIIQYGLGVAFKDTYPLLLAQLLAVFLNLHAAPSRSALLAMGQPQIVMRIALAATFLFFAVALSLIPIIGAMGASIAHIALGAMTALVSDIFWIRGTGPKQRKESQPLGT